MIRRPPLRLWFALAPVVLLIASALWLPRTPSADIDLEGAALQLSSDQSPLPTVGPTPGTGTSPLPTPSPTARSAAASPSWGRVGMALLWSAVGVLLALGIALVSVRWQRRTK